MNKEDTYKKEEEWIISNNTDLTLRKTINKLITTTIIIPKSIILQKREREKKQKTKTKQKKRKI